MTVKISDEVYLFTSEQSHRFKKIPTLYVAIIQILLCIAQIICMFLLPTLSKRYCNEVHSFGFFSILIYTHGAYWALFFIINQFLHFHHHKSMLQGYIELYVKTKNIFRAPFYILSVGNAVLIIVVMVLFDLCGSNNSCKHTSTTVDFLRGLITLESLVVITFDLFYIHILTDHHNKQLLPDVLREDLTSSSKEHIIGCLDQQHHGMEVLEHQAEMIRYLHKHTENLVQKILILSSHLNQKELL